MHQSTKQQPCRYCGGTHQPRQCPAYGKVCKESSKTEHFQKVCHSRKSRVINEMEQEVSQEYTEHDLEMVSINSVCFTKNYSMLTTKLEMYIGNKNMVIQYKIDIGSDGNIMPWYIFKNLFPRVIKSQLVKTIKNHIKLKTYNKTFITQLGICTVTIEYKIIRRMCECFVVPGYGQVLLGMPDTVALNIINVNIDS